MNASNACPVCRHEHGNTPRCPTCDFDLSEYAFANVRQQKALVEAHRAQWSPAAPAPETPEKRMDASASHGAALESYRSMLQMAWLDQYLDPQEISLLFKHAQGLGLTAEQAETLERDVIGRPILEQAYRATLLAARADQGGFSLSALQALPAFVRQLGIPHERALAVDLEVLGQSLTEALIAEMQRQSNGQPAVNRVIDDQEARIETEVIESWQATNSADDDLLKRWLTSRFSRHQAWRQAAERGHAGAQFLIGQIYIESSEEPQDQQAQDAVLWFRKAAEQGHALAQYALGNCYFGGYSVKEDKSEAVNWYRKAAEQGQADAQYRLGDCYLNRVGVKKDKGAAKEWFEKAAAQGHDKAIKALKEMATSSCCSPPWRWPR